MRKLCVVFLAAALVVCAVSAALATDYGYALVAVGEGNYIEEPELHENYDDAGAGYAGHNYFAKYRVPDVGLYIYDVSKVEDALGGYRPRHSC